MVESELNDSHERLIKPMLYRQDEISDGDSSTLQGKLMNDDYTFGGKYLIKEKICLFDKGTKLKVLKSKKGRKMRIASINKSGLFELYKFDDKSNIEKIKSYKNLVLSQFNVELQRKHGKSGIFCSLTDKTPNSSRKIQFYFCSYKTPWLEALKLHGASCPQKLPPFVPERLTAKNRGFKGKEEMKKASRISKADFTVSKDYEMECIATEMRVLLPEWHQRFVTLCGDTLTVYQGKDVKSGIAYSTDLKNFKLQPDGFSKFNIASTEENQGYTFPLALCVNGLTDMNGKASWIKHLSSFMTTKKSPNIHRNSGSSVKNSPSLGRKSVEISTPILGNRKSSIDNSPMSHRNSGSLAKNSPTLQRKSVEISTPMLGKRGSLGLGSSIENSPMSPRKFDRSNLSRLTIESTISRDTRETFIYPDSLNQTLESNFGESFDDKSFDNASGYITPTEIATSTLLSPTGTVDLNEIFKMEKNLNNLFAESVEQANSINYDNEILSADELNLDEAITLTQDKSEHVNKWLEDQEEEDDLEQDYLRLASNEYRSDSSEVSSSSDSSVDSLVTDKWLTQSLSQSQRVVRDLGSQGPGWNERRFSYQSQIRPDKHFSLNFEEYDGKSEEFIEEEYQLCSLKEKPDPDSRKFEYTDWTERDKIIEVTEQLVPPSYKPNYKIDLEVIGETSVEDYEVRSRSRSKNGERVISIVGKPRQYV